MHFAGIHRVYVQKKKKKKKTINQLYFLTIGILWVSESRCGQDTAIQNKVIRETMKKKKTVQQLLVN